MKLKVFQKYLRSNNIDNALFVNLSSRQQDWAIEYMTGIDDMEYGAFIVRQRSCSIITVGFEYERLKKSTSFPVKKAEGGLIKSLPGLIKKGVLGLNFRGMDKHTLDTIKKKLKCKTVDVSTKLLELRMTKTDKELSLMKKAASIGDKIVHGTLNSFRKFKTEQDVARHMLKSCIDHEVGLSFPTIVASGKHGAIPHHVPTKKLYNGFCVIDFGVKYKGYCSDMTRTVYLGTPSKKEKEIYNFLLEAQTMGVKMLVPGSDYRSIDKKLRETLGKYSKYFIHSFGHSLGMDVHDPLPFRTKTFEFVKDMVFTMEPGIYIPGKFGMRIEDDVLIRKKTKCSDKDIKRPDIH